MPSISFPLGPLWNASKYAWRSTEELLFKKIYERSHKEYMKRRELGKYWDDIGEDFEISFQLENPLSSEGDDPRSRVAIRNKTGRVVTEVNLTVTAESYILVYQEHIIIKDMGNKIYIRTLDNIPLNDLWFDEEGNIRTSYQRFYATLHSIVVDGQPQQIGAQTARFRPSHNDILNANWVRRWDKLWNLDYTDKMKREFNGLLYYLCFGNQEMLTEDLSRELWPTPECNTLRAKIRKCRLLIASPVYRLLSARRFSNILFWTLLSLRIMNLDKITLSKKQLSAPTRSLHPST